MKATVNQTEIEITLTMTREELNRLREGIGNTSHINRMKSGMTEEQSLIMSEFYDVTTRLLT
jgi:hypothetical protein